MKMIKKLSLLWICFAVVLPVIIPLFVSYIPGSGDGMAHKYRLVAFHNAINEGTFRPRWLGDVALGFGAPIFLYNYILPYYIIDIIYRVIGLVNLSGQIYGALTLVLSFLTMYLAACRLWGKKAGIAAAAVYTWAPYHLSSVYLYEGWGEMGGYIFPPLILYLMVQLIDSIKPVLSGKYQIANIKDQKEGSKLIYWYLLCVICHLLFIFTHNVSVLMFTPVLLLLAFVLGAGKIRTFITILSAFIIAAMISAFFSLPAILLNHLTMYHLLIDDAVQWRWRFYKSLGDLTGKSIELLATHQAHYEDFSLGVPIFLVGIFGIIIFARSIIHSYQREKVRYAVTIVLFLLLFLSLFLTSPVSGFLWNTGVLNWIVYPFRFLFLTVFASSLIAGYFSRKNYIVVSLFIITAIASGRAYTKPYVDMFPWPDTYFLEPQTISHPPYTKKNMAIGEFLPKWEDMDFLLDQQGKYTATRIVPPKFVLNPESGYIIQSIIKSEKITAELEMKKADNLLINTLYFPNWEAMIDGERVDIYRDNVGRMQIPVSYGRHTLELNFGYSVVEKVGVGISIVGMVLFITIPTFIKFRSKK